MSGAQAVPEKIGRRALLQSKTAVMLASAALGGALTSYATGLLLNPAAAFPVHLFQALCVAGGAFGLGYLARRNRAGDRNSGALAELTDIIRAQKADPDHDARSMNIARAQPTAQLARELNGLIDAFTRRESTLTKKLAEAETLRELSESSSLAKTQFLANMSHELRTPLNAIIGYATLLQEDAEAAGASGTVDDLSRILRAARHLLMLINDILDLSKIETGKSKIAIAPVTLKSLIEETLVDVGPQGRSTNICFEMSLPDEEVFLQTDALKVRQCLVNLLSNAFKFTSEGYVKLSVRIRPVEFGAIIDFTVQDTGIGISPEKIETLFDAFVQAEVEITQKYGGTGLGLAITRRLANLLGGELTVTSELNSGSEFTLSIPREPIQNPEVSDTKARVSSRPANDETNTARTALVIDDDTSNVDLLTRSLTKQGYSVVAAYDGETGLELAKNSAPDIILLDIHMPRQSGWDVLAALKTIPALSDVPVVIISVDDDRMRGIREGASEFLTKPVNQSELTNVLATYGARAEGHVLVIDEDEEAGNMIERAARQVGLNVSRAFDGETGLEMIRSHKPTAIVLDLFLPRRDGFSVLAELAATKEFQDIPVIVASARTLSGKEFHRITEAGCDFHAKGVSSPQEIAANLISVVGGKWPR